MSISILDSSGDPVSDLAITGLSAGATSDVVGLRFLAVDESHLEPRFVLLVEDAAGDPVREGEAPVDELWSELRLTGQDTSGDPTQVDVVTAWQRVGAGVAIDLPPILAGNYRTAELRMRVPSHAATVAYRWHLAVLGAEYSEPAPHATARGVVDGVGDPGSSYVVRGGEVTESATPDDEVHVAAVQYVLAGDLYGAVAADVQLDQDDGSAATLAVGESYYALVAVDASGVVAVKGDLGAPPVRPAIPAGHLVLRWVEVQYDAGGTSVIEAADLGDAGLYGRLRVVAGVGLAVEVHSGRAVAGGTVRTRGDAVSVDLDESVTSWVWQLGDGSYTATLTSAPPDTAALLLAEVDTDANVVTEVRDRRTWARPPAVLDLGAALPGSAGRVASVVASERMAIERVRVRQPDGGGGSAGQTQYDVLVDGTTIYTSHATEDHRPVIAYDATGDDLVDEDSIGEAVEVLPGQVVELATIEHPTGGDPAYVDASLLCRRY